MSLKDSDEKSVSVSTTEPQPMSSVSAEDAKLLSNLASTGLERDEDVEKIPTAGYKCDLIFNVFQNRAFEEPDFMKKLRVVFQFNITKGGKTVCVWTADNKSYPDVVCYRQPCSNVKPDCLVTIDDDDMLKAMLGKVNPQRLFMMGKIKIRGNIMLMQRLNSLWQEFQRLGKTPEMPLAASILCDQPLIPGLRSEYVIIDLVQRIVRLPGLRAAALGVHQINITLNGEEVSSWLIDLTSEKPVIRRGKDENATSRMMIDDYDFARLVLMKMRLADGIELGKIKTQGDQDKLLALDQLFSTPTAMKARL